MNASTLSENPPELRSRERGWVWRATPDSKKAGKISVLAVAETMLACAAYWWIAFRYDTHWHLLTSILIAPLLLLRSPDSIKMGVDWFLATPFKNWKAWPLKWRWAWTALFIILSGTASFYVCRWLAHAWLPGATGLSLFGISAAVGAVGLAVGISFAFGGSGPHSFTGPGFAAVCVAVGMAAAAATATGGPLAGFGAGAGVSAILIVLGPALGFGWLIRSLVCRLAATLRHLWSGWRWLPANWRENMTLTDSTILPELMPSIRERDDYFAFEGLLAVGKAEDYALYKLFYPAIAIILFVPVFLYRLSIKATAWFWWPLAFLLDTGKPFPRDDLEGEEKIRLKWPWTNPWQKTWTWFTILLAFVTLPGHFLDAGSLTRSLMPSGDKVDGVPFLMRLLQAVGWAGIRPWHWASAVIAACSLGMLIIAGRAVHHDANKHWAAYQKAGLRRDLCCMHMFKRVRLLATLCFWTLGLTALLLETEVIPKKLPLPKRQTEALRAWFAGK